MADPEPCSLSALAMALKLYDDGAFSWEDVRREVCKVCRFKKGLVDEIRKVAERDGVAAAVVWLLEWLAPPEVWLGYDKTVRAIEEVLRDCAARDLSPAFCAWEVAARHPLPDGNKRAALLVYVVQHAVAGERLIDLRPLCTVLEDVLFSPYWSGEKGSKDG